MLVIMTKAAVIGSFLADRYLLLGAQLSFVWRTGLYCLVDRYLLLGRQLGRFRNQQLTNQITEL